MIEWTRIGFLVAFVALLSVAAGASCAPADEAVADRSSALTAAATTSPYLVSFTSGGHPRQRRCPGRRRGRHGGGALSERRGNPRAFQRRRVRRAVARDVGCRVRRRGAIGPQPDRAGRRGAGQVGASARPPHPGAGADPLTSLQWDMDQIHAPGRAPSPAGTSRCWSVCWTRASTRPTPISVARSTPAPASPAWAASPTPAGGLGRHHRSRHAHVRDHRRQEERRRHRRRRAGREAGRRQGGRRRRQRSELRPRLPGRLRLRHRLGDRATTST